jgi:hypothetical protein
MKFQNERVNEYLTSRGKEIIKFDDQRPWGGWYIFDQGDSYQQSEYCGNETQIELVEHLKGSFDKKVLRVLPGTLLSLQFHGTSTHPGHSEIWQACTDIRVVLSKVSGVGLDEIALSKVLQELVVIDVKAGGTLFIPGGFIHALSNPYESESFVIETRISEIPEDSGQREDNIVSIYDQTQRRGAPIYPQGLFERIMKLGNDADYVVREGEVFDIRDQRGW